MAAAFFYLPFPTAFTSNGLPAPGARVFFYLTGTLTPADSFSTSDMETAHANPVVANGAGHLPAIYLNSAITYRVIIKDRTGTTLEDIDPYIPGTAAGAELLEPYSSSAAASATAAATAVAAANTAKDAAIAAAALALVNSEGKQGEPGPPGSVEASGLEFVTPQQFGAVADGVTNDGAAFVAALAHLKSIATAYDGNFLGSPKLYIPAGDYYIGNTTLDLFHTLTIEGDGTGMVGGIAVRLRWDGTVPCIRLQASNTTGDRQIGVNNGQASAGTILRGFQINGGGTATAGNHGVDAIARFVAEDVQVFNCGGNGFNIVASAGGGAGIEGNANCFQIRHCSAYATKNGIYCSGADANAGSIVGGDFSQNREWGVRDDSFLGNSYFGVHTAGNLSGGFKTTPLAAAACFYGCYTEGDQPASDFSITTVVEGGTHGAGVKGGSYAAATNRGRTFYSDVLAKTTNAEGEEIGNVNYRADSFSGTSSYRMLRQGAEYAAIAGSFADSRVYYNVQTGFKHSLVVNFEAVADFDVNGMKLGGGDTIKAFVTLTQTAYDALATKDANTIYLITA